MDARKMAETIENSTYAVDGNLSAYNVREVILAELSIAEEDKDSIHVYPMTDFMDAYNNEEIDENGTFMSYVSGTYNDE